ncbi:Oligopeptide transporter 3 [Trifolium repens]|nr:Oligopeptide transporter 3 [Trifolium repens]
MAPKNPTPLDTEKAANDVPPDDRCPIEEVALVVPETDDPTLPVMTFRSWFLGITSCVILIFLNIFFTFRTQPLTISSILMQIVVLPIGKLMAATLPTKEYNFIGWYFTLNHGPFNMKEHVTITIFANCGLSTGGGDAYSIGAVTIMKAYYQESLSFFLALLIVLSTQVYDRKSQRLIEELIGKKIVVNERYQSQTTLALVGIGSLRPSFFNEVGGSRQVIGRRRNCRAGV